MRKCKNKEDRDFFVQIGRAPLSESYEVQHVTWANNGKGAELYRLLQLPVMKEKQRSHVRMEEMIVSKEEGGAVDDECIYRLSAQNV